MTTFLYELLNVDGFTDWMRRRELRRQLPFLYRLFVCFCIGQKKLLPGQPIRKGARAFDVARLLTRKLSQPDECRISADKHVVYVDLMDARFLRVVSELFETSGEARALTRFLSAGDTFVDVGANHGSYSVMAAHLMGKSGKLIAIEPQPRLAKLLEKTLAENACCDYEISECAYGDSDGEIEFHISDSWSGTAGVHVPTTTGTHRTVVVPLKRFDKAFDWSSFPGDVFVKLDIEGSEYSFLTGAREFLTARKPILLLEVNPGRLEKTRDSWEKMSGLLQAIGYQSAIELDQLDAPVSIEQLSANAFRNVLIT